MPRAPVWFGRPGAALRAAPGRQTPPPRRVPHGARLPHPQPASIGNMGGPGGAGRPGGHAGAAAQRGSAPLRTRCQASPGSGRVGVAHPPPRRAPSGNQLPRASACPSVIRRLPRGSRKVGTDTWGGGGGARSVLKRGPGPMPRAPVWFGRPGRLGRPGRQTPPPRRVPHGARLPHPQPASIGNMGVAWGRRKVGRPRRGGGVLRAQGPQNRRKGGGQRPPPLRCGRFAPPPPRQAPRRFRQPQKAAKSQAFHLT